MQGSSEQRVALASCRAACHSSSCEPSAHLKWGHVEAARRPGAQRLWCGFLHWHGVQLSIREGCRWAFPARPTLPGVSRSRKTRRPFLLSGKDTGSRIRAQGLVCRH